MSFKLVVINSSTVAQYRNVVLEHVVNMGKMWSDACPGDDRALG